MSKESPQRQIDREFAGIVFDQILHDPEHIKLMYECGSVYRFADRGDYFATTLKEAPLIENNEYIHVFLHDQDTGQIVAYRGGSVVNQAGRPITSTGIIATRRRGKGLATLTELAFMAELTQYATAENKPIYVKKTNDLATTIRTEKERLRFVQGDAGEQLRQQIERRERAELPAWAHLFGGSGILGVNSELEYKIEPDEQIHPNFDTDEIVLARQTVNVDGKAVLRPDFIEGLSYGEDRANRKSEIINEFIPRCVGELQQSLGMPVEKFAGRILPAKFRNMRTPNREGIVLPFQARDELFVNRFMKQLRRAIALGRDELKIQIPERLEPMIAFAAVNDRLLDPVRQVAGYRVTVSVTNGRLVATWTPVELPPRKPSKKDFNDYGHS